jgi:nitroreductase
VLTDEEIATLCTAGGMAPSGANAQPWRVTVTGDRLVVAPGERPGGFLDVGRYASHLAVGCFAGNVAVAAPSLGLAAKPAVSDGTVEFAFTRGQEATPHELHGYLPQRVTNRRTDHTGPLPADMVTRLSEVDDGFRLVAVDALDRKRAIAEALGAADAVRMRNGTMFAEMVAEICWSDREAVDRREGLDIRTLELPGGTARLLALLKRFPRLRTLLPAARLGDTARELVAHSSHICCLSTSSALTPDAMVAAGLALERLWLTATRDGLSVHPWTVSTFLLTRLEVFDGTGLTGAERAQVSRVGDGLRTGFGLGRDEHPVFVFRLFQAPPPAARSLRLPWQSFTTVAE